MIIDKSGHFGIAYFHYRANPSLEERIAVIIIDNLFCFYFRICYFFLVKYFCFSFANMDDLVEI